MTRQRATSFPSPFGLEVELDPERKLWVPNRRDRIFVPSNAPAKPALDWGNIKDWTTVLWKPATAQEAYLRELENEARRLYFYEFLNDCSPGRSEYLGISREVPIRYRDIQRSEEPQFRPRIPRW